VDDPEIPGRLVAKMKKLKKLMPEPLLMLVVLEACIKVQVLPARNSPCHKRLRQIIRKWKKRHDSKSA
jgi:hypothetical protein